MVLAVLAGSAIGPAFKYMQNHNIPASLAASWRCQTMVCFLIPLALVERQFTVKENRVQWFKKFDDLRYPLYVHVSIAGVAWAGNIK